MFLVRMRTFLEWHQREGSPIEVLTPTDPAVAGHLGAMEVFQGLELSLDRAPEPTHGTTVLPLRTVDDSSGIEDLADEGVRAVEARGKAVARLASPFHMAVGELGDNAVTHGRSDLGVRVAASIGESGRVVEFAIGDLGVGIPNHIRQTHPEWGDDTAAIAKALETGVSGVRDPQRGNGFFHIQDAALTARLSAAQMEIYAANGFLRLQIVQASFVPTPLNATAHKRGTWISYSLISTG